MTEFTLDTSGAVHLGPDHLTPNGFEHWHWHYLDAFTQGYVEALFQWISEHASEAGLNFPAFKARGYRALAFRDLARETLAAILKDCAAMSSTPPDMRDDDDIERAEGRRAWAWRQEGRYPRTFPPVTVTLADDGKVYLQEIR